MPIQCDIVTQERMVFSGQVDAVNPVSYTHLTLPTSDLV